MADTHVRRCSASIITREMPGKTTVRYPFIPIRMGTIKSRTKQSPRRQVLVRILRN